MLRRAGIARDLLARRAAPSRRRAFSRALSRALSHTFSHASAARPRLCAAARARRPARLRERRPHERRAHPLDDVHELPEVEPPDILQHDHRLGAVEQRQCLREPLGHRRIDARPHHRLDGEREQPPAVAAPVLRLVLRAPRTLVRPLMQRHLQRGAQRALVLLHARIREVEQLVHARLDRRRRRLPLQHRPEALVDDGAHERRLRREVAVSGGARHAGCVRELGDRWKPALFEHRQRSLQQQLAGLRARFGQRFRCGYGSRHVSCEDDR
ncbi:transcriptional regulator, TetR family domain protein [Burkholderia mallei]|nr:transcriptional regulator, TetR family domain protein [Burkholderia mallei]KOT01983.1 transcriptional regulator, TetR family domain protein [Burkholderia mallei]